MKMESEFKATKAGIVKEIPVNEGDTVGGPLSVSIFCFFI
jgi:biotin carboxyl carrier protein